jgi:4-hydroxybenzoyl-CoA reductase beta subunit
MDQTSYTIPNTIAEALHRARQCAGDYIYLGGGTDILALGKHGLSRPAHRIDLSRISELAQVMATEDTIEIGSMVTLDGILSSKAIAVRYPLIAQAAQSVATPVIRKSATLGGNLLVKNRCTFYNQSSEWRETAGGCLREGGDTCRITGTQAGCYSRNVSDLAAALIALDARIAVVHQQGQATFPLADLYAPDGIHTHRGLSDDAILVRIAISMQPVSWWYRKLRLRRSIDFTSLTVAATVDRQRVARFCTNGVSMAPVLVQGSLDGLTPDGLAKRVRQACNIVDNDLLPREYRREMLGLYLSEWWKSVAGT